MLTTQEQTQLNQVFKRMLEGDCKAWVRKRARECGIPQAMLESMDEFPDYILIESPDGLEELAPELAWELGKAAAAQAQDLRKENKKLQQKLAIAKAAIGEKNRQLKTMKEEMEKAKQEAFELKQDFGVRPSPEELVEMAELSDS